MKKKLTSNSSLGLSFQLCLLYASENPTDVREFHTFKGSSDWACVLGVLWKLRSF